MSERIRRICEVCSKEWYCGGCGWSKFIDKVEGRNIEEEKYQICSCKKCLLNEKDELDKYDRECFASDFWRIA